MSENDQPPAALVAAMPRAAAHGCGRLGLVVAQQRWAAGTDGPGRVPTRVAAEPDGALPEEAELLETGLGGIGIVHALMDGYHALVIVDAVERDAQPGTVFVLVPQVPDIATPTFDEWLAPDVRQAPRRAVPDPAHRAGSRCAPRARPRRGQPARDV